MERRPVRVLRTTFRLPSSFPRATVLQWRGKWSRAVTGHDCPVVGIDLAADTKRLLLLRRIVYMETKSQTPIDTAQPMEESASQTMSDMTTKAQEVGSTMGEQVNNAAT